MAQILLRDRTPQEIVNACEKISTIATQHPKAAKLFLRFENRSWEPDQPFSLDSPDPLDEAKMAWIAAARDMTAADPRRFVFLYQDEFTYYRRPAVDRGDAAIGSDGPWANQGHGSNTKRRIIGSLDVDCERRIAWQRSDAGRATLIRYDRAVEAAYPEATTIFLAQDNWPVHRHPDIEAALSATRTHPLWLPTDAPWTNPIEKVWRRLNQELLHLHGFEDRWEDWVGAVEAWLGRWADGSRDLLNYVGLHPN